MAKINSPDTPLANPQPAVAAQIEALSGDPNFMTSLARGLAVIAAFSQQQRRLSISQISHKTNIPRAAVRRCLFTLAALGYVAEDERAFSLRPKMLTLGYAYLSSTPLSALAAPMLERVSGELHESCSLAVLDGDDVVYVARSKTPHRIMSVDLGIGSRLPAYCTSLGRVLIAALAPEQLDAYLARVTLARHTNRTVTTRKQLKQSVDTVRASGYAIVDQELEIGLRSVAVPVRDHSGRTVAAMNVGTQVSRVPVSEMESRFVRVLSKAADELRLLLA